MHYFKSIKKTKKQKPITVPEYGAFNCIASIIATKHFD